MMCYDKAKHAGTWAWGRPAAWAVHIFFICKKEEKQPLIYLLKEYTAICS